jgi:Iron-containing redox enzyme
MVEPGRHGEPPSIALFPLSCPSLSAAPVLPTARGPVSERLLELLAGPPRDISAFPSPRDDALTGDDSALALYVLYELHYRSFEGVDDGWEWEPSLLRERARLEAAFERRLRDAIGDVRVASEDVLPALVDLAIADGPSLSAHMADRGSLSQMREFAIHRSAYQLKEADPHTWAIPRLSGPAKAALVDIQVGEYGDGIASEVHAELFAETMRELGLDATYGAYLDRIPGVTLSTVNLVSMFGLHRRRRGALVGHLTLFEMCSVVPMGRYAGALRRFGFPSAARFYDAHVEADRRHEIVALYDMAGALADDEPALAADIVFGARAVQLVEGAFAAHLLDAWSRHRSSLLAPSR